MKALLISRTTLIWFLLLGATLLSWEMGLGVGFDDVRYASVTIIVVSFIKVRLVMSEFMELREAPHFLRLLADGWIFVITLLLVWLYLN